MRKYITFQSKLLLLSILMLSASICAIALRPTYQPIERPTLHLESSIPKKFNDWVADESDTVQIINPEQKETIDKVYADTVTRTYRNSQGRRIMLSVAYGEKQAYVNQVHKPEVCYSAQGFQIINKSPSYLKAFDGRIIKTTQLIATHSGRIEPITYWIRMGKIFIQGSVEQNLVRVNYGLKGIVPDGLLFRVSEINSEIEDSYQLQNDFINQLLLSSPTATRDFLVGDSFPQ
ncbi:exosortase-associated protein EpsI, B-type [Methylophilus methylotrophus]|uniref:exosortase-associated protein EpsI, B-type n=1 Tax=Methylophilus methylotrophus TaxID=17 RepID=UPI000F5B6518|nr:exosortase-associated protein EpsI, B-type [Methylophilus methylotrophus]